MTEKKRARVLHTRLGHMSGILMALLVVMGLGSGWALAATDVGGNFVATGAPPTDPGGFDTLLDTDTPTATSTETPTNAPTDTPTSTPTITNMATHTSTSTVTRVNTYTRTTTPTPTFTLSPTLTNTPTDTSSVTLTITPGGPTLTPTPIGVVHGHLTWQGVAAVNRPNVTGTLSLCVNGMPRNFSFTTDTGSYFTITTDLPDGVYHWWVKGGRQISNASPINGPDAAIGGGAGIQEFGTQRGGDANATNNIDTLDFNILKNGFSFGGGPSDFNYDMVRNATDFNILRNNFGLGGNPLTCP